MFFNHSKCIGPAVVSDDDACVSWTSFSLAGRLTLCGVRLGISGGTNTQLTNEIPEGQSMRRIRLGI
jgi:hypothetical protein